MKDINGLAATGFAALSLLAGLATTVPSPVSQGGPSDTVLTSGAQDGIVRAKGPSGGELPWATRAVTLDSHEPSGQPETEATTESAESFSEAGERVRAGPLVNLPVVEKGLAEKATRRCGGT